VTGTGMAGIVRAGASTAGEPVTVAAARPAGPADTTDALPSAAETLAQTDGPVRDTLPPGTVLLRVIRQRDDDGVECFRLELQTDREFEATATKQELRNQRRPHITLAAAATRKAWSDVPLRLKSWSDNKQTLQDWLTALRERYGTGLRLIIWDETGFEIPWELFALRGPRRRWLGAEVELIRWTAANTGASTGAVCHGPVLSFVDPSVGAIGLTFARWPYEELGTMKQLVKSLADERRDVGLVHVWAHGTVGTTGREATLGGMTMDQLRYNGLGALRGRRTLVLLNACSGAQLMDDKDFNEQATRSFAQYFLEEGAPGVVATAGEVGRDHSIAMLTFLLSRTAQGTRSVSGALLEYRAKLAAQLPEDPWDVPESELHRLQKFVYGFMYQYLGYFDTTLQLPPKEAAG
jgi:hypothetical protein